MGCTSEGARRAANLIYRRGILAAAPDPVDLTNPLPIDPDPAVFNAGLQPNTGETVVISLAFLGAGDVADISIINWGNDKDGNQVALSVRDLTQVAAGVFTDPDGAFFGTELVEPCNAPLFEIRVRANTGTIDKIRVWTY
ncbi:hypothetical protein LCGC14_0273550 [marine sediment metagenome]|uniref:Uncharacterized protein n=2 Tax=root TaxID=1 RepID=A0A9C9TJ30_9HYPH|nr:hypothetical protein [Aurantimonas coralicida]